MNIIELQINDIKRISAIEVDPVTGEPVILTGDNAQGKSSVLDAIVFALSNSGLDDPIRHGRPSGSITVKLGADKVEYTVERKVTKKGSYLTLKDAEGNEVSKAQTFLNGLMGNYAFDPLAFTSLKPKEQVEALKTAAGLDFTELDANRAQFYAERTTIGRDGKELKARFEAMAKPADDVPAEEVSATELMAKVETLHAAERKLSQAIDQESRDGEAHARALQEVEKIKAQLAEAEAKADAAGKVVAASRDAVAAARAAAPSAEEIAAARAAVQAVDTTNAAVRAARTYRETEEKLKELRLKHANLDRRIEEIDEAKKEAIKNAALPLDGLELTDDGVLFGGTFFSQLSSAEQIRVSTLVAMSQNPTLKIVLVREGALMNRANLQMMADLARERGYQLWIEKFQEEPGSKGVHIVDGAISHVDGEPVAV